MNRLPSASSPLAHYSLALASLLAVGLLAIFASSASAASTFGSSLAHSPNDGSCGGHNGTICGNAISDIAVDARAEGGLNAPSGGVIVRWRIRGLPGTAISSVMSLRVLRGNTVAGVSADVTPALSGAIETFDTRIPVEAADRLGLQQTITGVHMASMTSLSYSAAGSGVTNYWAMPPALGETATPTHSDSDRELLLNADVEADVDADGYGDETQDLCPSNSAVQSACPAAPPNPIDTIKPIVSSLKLKGTKGFSFASTEAGSYMIEIDRISAGRLRGENCSRTARRGERCKNYRRHKRESASAVAGTNAVALSTKRYRPGRYCIRVVVIDAAGNASEPVDREFTVRKKRR